MKALILINAFLESAQYKHQYERLKAEFLALGVQADIVKNDLFLAYVKSGEIEARIQDYSFCVYLDKDKYMSELLEMAGLRLFNCHKAISVCDDKMCTHIALLGKGIAMPTTLSGLLCYDSAAIIPPTLSKQIADKLGFPLVVKQCFGSMGKGVFLAENENDLQQIMKEVKMQPHLFQQFISSSYGKDVRVIVIGGKVFAAMQRTSNGDFRSNIELGGKGSAYVLNSAFIEICEKVACELSLDYAGIDILFGENNQPILCEVNSNAFFCGIESCTGFNVAAAYCQYILNEIKNKKIVK